jgi:hypothetical protein
MSKWQTESQRQQESRRQFLLLAGGAALSLPFLAASGCAPEEAEPPPTSDEDPRDDSTDDPVPETPPDQDATDLGQRPDQVGGEEPAPPETDMPKLEETDAMAQALGYKHDASEVDIEQFPSRADADSINEYCKNCVHYQASPEVQWAPCTIFPGKLVNADGWCSAWAAIG